MSVGSQIFSISYLSDGVTSHLSIPYYFMALTDLVVVFVLNNVAQTLLLNTDYLISGTPNSYGAYPSGGTVNFQPGRVPVTGGSITISRVTARLQPDHYIDGSAFPATVNESDLDRLTLLVQEVVMPGFLGVLPGIPATGPFVQGNWFIYASFVAGGAFGSCCVQSGFPGLWKDFGPISL